MKKAISAKQKLGRPATGIRPMIGFRADPELRAAVEKWAAAQPDQPTLSDAIRRLVELGLTMKTAAKPTSRAAARATKLGASTIAKHADASAPEDDAAGGIRAILADKLRSRR